MSDYKFSPDERFAIFTIHGEKCYLCGRPINLKEMEVDHIIPEALLKDETKLLEALMALGRPNNFNLNSFANWLPACHTCNNRKSNIVFNPSGIAQINLQIAAGKVAEANKMLHKSVSDKEIGNALNTLQRAFDRDALGNDVITALTPIVQPLALMAENYREPKRVGKPLHLAPLFTILSEKDGIRMVKGPYGVGGGSTSPHAPTCPVCGHSAWNGARCVICGDMNDD